MDLGLKGKRALVMSSSRGLGLGIAKVLAEEGADVLLSGRSEDRLAAEVAAINAKGQGRAHWVACDLARDDAAETLAQAVAEKLGAADILVANTGGPPPGKMVDADPATLTGHFNQMVLRVIETTDKLLPAMRKAGWGRVLAIGSSGVIQPIPTLAVSNTIRSALVGWSKSLSNDLAAEGITVNMLIPGRIHTERVDELDAAAAKRGGVSIDEARMASASTIPAGRYGTVEEFAKTAAFLVSAPASYITGSLVRCDGGSIRSV
ncbi:SDR family oxidoreductase [Frigidibacter sp. ROC022]|uniref:SDR family oxidoreductase n=1 Tax=Frigidibacter sp. ROC022 TaxID=2971796 RepID=UPI00215B4CCF|nr:SDR family oxidoreductase [Frigidibacter sp. ROC022]MCR8723390.1 SDR family oxidoreductase [Frigidibacter sp. ROC022]